MTNDQIRIGTLVRVEDRPAEHIRQIKSLNVGQATDRWYRWAVHRDSGIGSRVACGEPGKGGHFSDEATAPSPTKDAEVATAETDAALEQADLAAGALDGPLLDAIRAATKENRFVETKLVGGPLMPLTDAPTDVGLLIGFELCVVEDGSALKIVRWLRPIFLTAKGEVRGKAIGAEVAEKVTIKAKPGFAVGAIRYRAGAAIDNIQLVFMRIGVRIDPNDSYESEAMGGNGGSAGVLTGDGAPVVGIRVSDVMFAATNGLKTVEIRGIGSPGLVLLPKGSD